MPIICISGSEVPKKFRARVFKVTPKASKVPKSFKAHVCKVTPKATKVPKKLKACVCKVTRDKTFVRARMALALEPGGRPIEKFINADQLKNVAARALAALDDKPFKESVKKLTLTEFGQYMKTVQKMNSDRVEEQKKDCFNFVPIPKYPPLFNYN